MPERVDANAIARKLYSKAEKAIGDVKLIDSDIERLSPTIDRSTFKNGEDNKQVGEMFLEVSYDGGQTFLPWGSNTFNGGKKRNQRGNIQPFSGFEFSINPEQLDSNGQPIQRMYRLRFIANEDIDAKIDCDLLKPDVRSVR